MSESLVKMLNNSTKVDKKNFISIAVNFQKLVNDLINNIWLKHKSEIHMKVNEVEFCKKGSAVNSSTAIGFIVEEFLVQQLPDGMFSTPTESTVQSLYDLKYKEDSKIELLVNLKVEKSGSVNSGVCAANKLVEYYGRNKKPKLYLVLKSKYSIDETNSKIIFEGTDSFYLESFITKKEFIRSDSRNWSTEFNALSGRLQHPNSNILNNLSLSNLESPEKILDFIKHSLGNALIESKL